MAESKTGKEIRGAGLESLGNSGFHWFWLLLAGLTCFLAVHATQITYAPDHLQSGTFVEQFLKLRPNEIGDALAGIFGSLAFVAAAVAVALQSNELRMQREVLAETKDEVRKQREAHQKMVTAMERQGKLLSRQVERVVQIDAKEEFEQLIQSLFLIAAASTSKMIFEESTQSEKGQRRGRALLSKVSPEIRNDEEKEMMLRKVSRDFQYLRELLDMALLGKPHSDNRLFSVRLLNVVGEIDHDIDNLCSVLHRMNSCFEKLSDANRERYNRLEIAQFLSAAKAVPNTLRNFNPDQQS